MRLAHCRYCHLISRLSDYKGTNPDHDVVLQDWIERHLHGYHPDDTAVGKGHPGGMIATYDVEKAGIDRTVRQRINPKTGVVEWLDEPEELSVLEEQAVMSFRADLAKAQQDVFDYRDELREDAVKCHQRHHQPEAPGSPCIDYRSATKRLGRANVPDSVRQFLCTYCPYESSVTVMIRAARGDYR